ncbi:MULTISPECIES: Flp family type IVb pilin [unclassified Anaeromyxobacter]|uniref:Flp family type IVb pilin n=1 Tax=unclassified Anaeromyxobacter TaxID=2620896 RepID=UPI001F5970D5|nr:MULTISPECIES: Flp family type IVb pilin [unclassified Anaeromyxobacter]
MSRLLHVALRALWADESAPTTVEYAIMAAGIAVAIFVAVGSLGGAVNGLFDQIATTWP